jgi:ERCC4-type nuclease
MDIIVDTREQKPLWKKGTAIFFKLLVGDYSTMLLRNRFCIERKSLQDLYGTITSGHRRFRNELIRAEVNEIALLLFIEGTKKDFLLKKFPGGSLRKLSGETLCKIIDTVEKKYKIEVVWCGNRTAAKTKIFERLKLEETKYKNYGRKIKK